MKLSDRADIEAPADFVWSQLTDFDGWERAALRRGAEVARLDSEPVPVAGMAWAVAFVWRGKTRKLDLRTTAVDPGHRLAFAATGPNVEGTLGLDLVDMGPKRSRLTAGLEVRPRTLTARLFLQGLKLARSRVDRRFSMRLRQLSAEIEGRWQATQAQAARR
ncbi:MAG TPA: SRPBCC family protein [Paracoccaceae bacterium]|nr:SRPBCC family protein [Paracoccaceae bacterium]HMO70461.1 SRPBCC family protein [Paracoccaceae bacterium]